MNNNLNEIGSIETIRRIWRSYASGLTGYLSVALLCIAIVALSTPALPELIRRVIDDIFIDKKRSSFPENIIKKVFKGVLTALIENKEIEGYKIKKTFSDRIKKIHKNLTSLANEVAKNKHKRKKNILNKLPSSLVVSDESISNEVVNQIIKSDISEEIDRLEFHKSSLLEELGSKKAKGKKIDFILLEMLREVNTILAKVTFSKEKKYALDIKIYIEEMREQVSNVE